MLEPCVNQAAGLQALALQHAPRLVAVASHGLQTGELPLLWGLCTCWVELGLSVLVLDAHAQESVDNPGLAQWLDNPLQHAGDAAPAPSWQVLPAATGLHRLHDWRAFQNQLAHLFQQRDIVLIYTNAATLVRLLAGSALPPLIVVPPALSTVVSAYATLKHLLRGQLHPSIANIVPIALASGTTTRSASHLAQCANAFLGYRVQPITVAASSQPLQSRDDLHHLALQLFENALPLEPVQRSERVH
ncbi:MAG: hypothetical protein PHH58_04845 [Rhodoferax sp.]|nr:hypothetical protein [Rhodoferax sp.]